MKNIISIIIILVIIIFLLRTKNVEPFYSSDGSFYHLPYYNNAYPTWGRYHNLYGYHHSPLSYHPHNVPYIDSIIHSSPHSHMHGPSPHSQSVVYNHSHTPHNHSQSQYHSIAYKQFPIYKKTYDWF